MNEELDIFNGAPTVVIVSGKEAEPNSVTECALASENMLIAAQSLGIASCYIISINSLFEGDEAEYFLEKIGVPSGYTVRNAVLLGYNGSDMIPEAAPRKEDNINYIR